MANMTLQKQALLGGYSQRFDNTMMSERTNLSILSLAVPLGAKNTVDTTLNQQHGVSWPDIGKVHRSNTDQSIWLGLQQDQCFALFSDLTDEGFAQVSAQLQAAAYITDQSDSWVCINIDGPLARTALERICPIDLHPTVLGESCVTRTTMEHLAVIIHCTGSNSFELLSPSSSAKSFLHALETSFHNIA